MIRNVSGRWRVWIFCGVIVAAVMWVFAISAGRVLVVDAPQQSDVIVVLAGETDVRPQRGLQLLGQGYGRSLVIDVPAAAKIFEFTEIQLASNYFRTLPEAVSVRICPIAGRSTRDEVRDVEGCLTEKEKRVLIVTSDYHTRRALSIFRNELRGRSFSVAAAYDGTEFGTDWWRHREWAKTCVDEWLKLVWWNTVDRWDGAFFKHYQEQNSGLL